MFGDRETDTMISMTTRTERIAIQPATQLDRIALLRRIPERSNEVGSLNISLQGVTLTIAEASSIDVWCQSLLRAAQHLQDLVHRSPGGTATRGSEPPHSRGLSLTTAERAVVELVVEGLTNKQIGAKLFVSHRTVDTHVSHVLTKLGFTSRVQLARLFATEPIRA